MENNNIVHKRKEKALFRAVSEIIGVELTNADVEFCTVTKVKLSNDGSNMKVYLTFSRNTEKAFAAVQRSKGFIRSKLASNIGYRIVPKLDFILDDTFENAQKIESILKELKNKK